MVKHDSRYRFDHQVIALVLTAGLIVILHFTLHPVRILGMSESIFYLDEKYTLATFYSVTVSFLTGYLYLAHAGFGKTKLRRAVNMAFGLFFALLSFDEMFEVHEYVNTQVKEALGTGNLAGRLSHLSWIFPLSGVILITLLLMVAKFKLSPPRTLRFIAAGIACFALVLVFELVGSTAFGRPEYVTYVGLEEGFEMLGITLMFAGARAEADSAS